MKKIIFALLGIVFATNSWAYMQYEIEVAHNDELFIINGEKFSAQTYCFASDGFDRGDFVVFLDGDPFGACDTATIANPLTGETCDLWCE